MLEGQNAGKEMFDKGELAAILRFGAENLFAAEKGDKQAIEEVQKRDENLYEEDLDDILARAEVVDQRMQVRSQPLKSGWLHPSKALFCMLSYCHINQCSPDMIPCGLSVQDIFPFHCCHPLDSMHVRLGSSQSSRLQSRRRRRIRRTNC